MVFLDSGWRFISFYTRQIICKLQLKVYPFKFKLNFEIMPKGKGYGGKKMYGGSKKQGQMKATKHTFATCMPSKSRGKTA